MTGGADAWLLSIDQSFPAAAQPPTCVLNLPTSFAPPPQFGLPTGKHVFLYAPINGENVMRAYTPTSTDAEKGYFDLVIKVYRCVRDGDLTGQTLRSSSAYSPLLGLPIATNQPLPGFLLTATNTPPPPPKNARANEHPNFPEGGKMSQHLDSMALGDTLEVKGPVGHFVYHERGTYSLNNKKGERFGFV
jgi:nitrate reductase (NAD(P)H)